jgi:hypothetical protein
MKCPYCGEPLELITKDIIACEQCEAIWREELEV